MDPEHKDAIRDNLVYLVENIPIHPVLDQLCQHKILTNCHREEITSENTNKKRNRALLSILLKRGPKAFPALCQALTWVDRPDIVEKLNTFPVRYSNPRYRWRYIWSEDGRTIKTSPHWYHCLIDCQQIGRAQIPHYETNDNGHGPEAILVIETKDQ